MGQESSHLSIFDQFLADDFVNASDRLYGVAQRDVERLHSQDINQIPFALHSAVIQNTWSKDNLIEQLQLANSPKQDREVKMALSKIYFDDQQYKMALETLQTINVDLVEDDQQGKVNFLLGYLYLINKDFNTAHPYLDKTVSIGGDLKTTAIYYRGINSYFLGDLQEAASDFKKVNNAPAYAKYIPYYLTQIYFSEGDYNKVIEYGKDYLGADDLENRFEIEKLLAQSYYKIGDYRNSLFHFKRYEQNTAKLTKEEFYQIAYTYYELGEYENAIDPFLQISKEKGDLGNLANYYLSQSYLKAGDKNSALATFKNVMTLSSDPLMKSAATYNYAKLSYELGNDRVAINTLLSINEEDPNYVQAQTTLSEILIRSNDYEYAISTIDQIKFKSNSLNNTYQKLNFKAGVKALQDRDYHKATKFLHTSRATGSDVNLKLNALYWMAYLENKNGQSQKSQSLLTEYFKLNPSENLDSYFQARYLQAYHYFNGNQLPESLYNFEKAERQYIPHKHDEAVLRDIQTRIADCYFQENKYDLSIPYYEKASASPLANQAYASYQIGTIKSLKGKHYESIIEFEELAERFPDSELSDDAYYQAGLQYQGLRKPVEALNAFKQIIEPPKTNSDLLIPSFLNAALICYNKGDYKCAVNYYSQVFAYHGNGSQKNEALTAMKEIYIEDLNDPQGYFDFVDNKAGVTIDEFEKDSLSYIVGKTKFRDGKYREAINGYDQYLQNFRQGYFSDQARYYRAESYSILNEYSSALTDYEYFVDKYDNRFYQESVKKAALIAYNHEENYSKAALYFTRAIQTDISEKEKEEFYLANVISMYKTESHSDLVITANHFLSLPNTKDLDKARVSYYKGKSNLKLNQMDEAITAFNKVIALSENNQAAEASFHIAEIFHGKGDYNKALSQAMETTKRAANYPYWVAKSLLLASDVYIRKDDLLNARAAATAVQENYSENPDIVEEVNLLLKRIEILDKENSRVKETQDQNILELDGAVGTVINK